MKNHSQETPSTMPARDRQPESQSVEPESAGSTQLQKRLAVLRRGPRKLLTRIAILLAGLSLNGCASFTEDHFFAQPLATENSVKYNFLRVRVEGSARLAKSRYVAGYYDPRALDLFFNEIKSVPNAPADIPRIFEQNVTLPGTDERLIPLKDNKTGDFTMIFSTNATAVANAIGNFAEANATADAITNLLNDERVGEHVAAKATLMATKTRAAATVTELDAAFARVGALRQQNQPVDAEMIRLLNALARGLGATAPLADVLQAETWFRARRLNAGGTP